MPGRGGRIRGLRTTRLARLFLGLVGLAGLSPIFPPGAPVRIGPGALHAQASGGGGVKAVSLTELVSRGAWEEILALAEQARAGEPLGFARLDGDLAHAYARALLSGRADPRAALEALSLARTKPERRDFPAQEDALLEASIRNRLGQYESALRVLEDSPVAAALSLDYALSAVQAYYGLGQGHLALLELSRAAARFPEDPRPARIFFLRERAGQATEDRRLLADLFLKRLPVLASRDPELELLALPFVVEAERRDLVLRSRLARGERGRLLALRALRYGYLGFAVAMEDFFSDPAPLFAEELRELAALAGSAAERDSLASRLGPGPSGFTGTLLADRNGDGLPESRTEYRRGLPSSFKHDADQDGRAELEALFPAEGGLELRAAAGGAVFTLTYLRYPYLAELRKVSGPESLAYSYPPESFLLPLVAFEAFPRPGSDFVLVGASGSRMPSDRALAGTALRVAKRAGGEEELVYLEGGIPLQAEYRRAGTLYAVTEYSRGRPVRQRSDRDGDGRFESLVEYEASSGEARVFLQDADGDGAPDYRESLVAPFRKEWDYDGDGLFDAAEERLAQGGIKRLFSSRLDGAYDEELLFDREGRLLSARRGGRELALIADANPRLRWIGSKPFDLGGNLPATEGLFRHMGKRYRIIHHGSEAFAELVP